MRPRDRSRRKKQVQFPQDQPNMVRRRSRKVRVEPPAYPGRVTIKRNRKRRKKPFFPISCIAIILVGCLIAGITLAYLAIPNSINILLLGIDYTEPGSAVGRSDTIILTTFIPTKFYIGMLSVPRDLWVTIPNIGENRINTAHFFAEIQQTGSGPRLAQQTINLNFGLDFPYFMRIRFDGFREVVNAMDGVDLELEKPMAGYPAGKHHLTGNKALAFVRDRQGSDDFHRMEQSHIMLKAVFLSLIQPDKWAYIPEVIKASYNAVDTNVPLWLWPKLIITLAFVGLDGIDSRIISRDMVFPFFTSEGANVLNPNWAAINPVLVEMFGR